MTKNEIQKFLKDVKKILNFKSKQMTVRELKINAGTIMSMVDLGILKIQGKVLIESKEKYATVKILEPIGIINGQIINGIKCYVEVNCYEKCFNNFEEYLNSL